LKDLNVIGGLSPTVLCVRNEGGTRIKGNERVSTEGGPLVSVITVVYNGASTIEHTILSVIEQSYDNVEHIIIDGGSTDATLSILQKYNNQINYWVSENDRGIYDAMNKGIALANGDFIGMLNADDYFADPFVLAEIVLQFKGNNVDVVFSCLDIVDPRNLNRVRRKYRVSKLSKFMLRIGVMPPHPTFYCRKSCYETAGQYRIDYKIAADFEMLARLLTKHHITWRFFDKSTIKMRSGGVSNSGIRSKWVVNCEIIRACKENGLYTNIFLLLFKLPIRLIELVF
jgi:glycosyltransferase involved in cell wall biosynthesis